MLDYSDDTKYKGSIPYPNRSDFQSSNVYKAGEVILVNARVDDLNKLNNTVERLPLRNVIHELKKDGYILEHVFDKETFNGKVQEYRKDQRNATDKWIEDISEHYDCDFANDPVGQLILDRASREGNSYGLSEVDSYLDDYMTELDSILKVMDNSAYCKGE